MKQIFFGLLAGLFVAACSTETSDNGNLDGLWQLSSVDTLGTGGTKDMRSSQITWAVQGSVLETRLATSFAPFNDIIFSFSLEGDKLTLKAPHVSDRDQGDVKVEKASLQRINELYHLSAGQPEDLLRQFGINSLEEQFKVIELSSDRMTLESNMLRLWLRKY